MYTIEFRGKHQHKKPIITSSIKDTCHNIKSVTIDVKDIEYVRYCDFSKKDSPVLMLGGLVNGVQRLNKNRPTEQVTILNDSGINETYIYAILNCDWMLSSEDTDYDTLLLKAADELDNLYKEIEVEPDSKEQAKLQNRITLIEYRMTELANKRTEVAPEEPKTNSGNTLIFSAIPSHRRTNNR